MKEDINLDIRSLIEGHTDVDSLLACTIRSVIRLQEMLIEYIPEITGPSLFHNLFILLHLHEIGKRLDIASIKSFDVEHTYASMQEVVDEMIQKDPEIFNVMTRLHSQGLN